MGFFVVLFVCCGCVASTGIIKAKVSSKKAKIMGGKLISTFLLGMYFLYLTISRRALEIFNCNPVEPDDGFTYTHFTSINCDGGLCRCWDPNHVQLFLVPFSIVAILLMTVGFPVWLFLLLRSKKNAIKEDQYLRALDIAPVETNNPVAFFNRLKYHKMWVFYLCCDVLMFWFLIFGFAIDAGNVGLGFSTDLAMPFLCFPNFCHNRYYHFKPGKVYWIVFIIARKGLISAAGLLFRSNPGFQLSFVLLVLFWAYVQQVQNKPFMSSVERKTVILEHQVKVTMGDQLHIQLAARIAVAKAEERKSRAKQRNKQRNKLVNDFVGNSTGERESDMDTNKQKLNYFWNYNTVESVLLSSLIIVCVCGVMFESDRFQENQNVPSGNGFGQFVTFQRDLVTYACIIVIFGSMFFYFAVAYSEIFGQLPLWMRKVLCLKKQIDLHEDTDMYGENDGRNSEVHMEFNPHMLAERDRLAAHSATEAMEVMLQMQQDQMRREKLRTARLLEKGRAKGGRGNKKKRKKEMGGTCVW